MSIFETKFPLLRAPDGGVEDLAAMKAAGDAGVFCNIGDYPPNQWNTIRQVAHNLGMFCGPWLRTQSPPNLAFDPMKLDLLIYTADEWKQPFVVNSERELDGTGGTCTSMIASKVGKREAAVTMEAWLYNAVDWKPIGHLPMLLQISPRINDTSKYPMMCKEHAHDLGIKCVYFMFGTFGGQVPSDYDLKAPYSLYTADDCGGNYQAWKPTSYGFKACIEEAKPVTPLPTLTPKQVPYTGPYYPVSTNKAPSSGKTVEALKRAMSRLGYMDWVDFTPDFGPILREALKAWQKKERIPASGQYGKASWVALRSATITKNGRTEYALDFVARKLIQDEANITSESAQEAKVQKYIAEFWNIAIAHESVWHYNENIRPYDPFVDPAKGGYTDCSATVFRANGYSRKKTGLNVVDPAKQNWTGYGNTDMYEDDWPKISQPFRIGDLAHFDSPHHVIQCIKPGDIHTAQWGSMGREAGPELIASLVGYYRYPHELRFIVRPQLLA